MMVTLLLTVLLGQQKVRDMEDIGLCAYLAVADDPIILAMEEHGKIYASMGASRRHGLEAPNIYIHAALMSALHVVTSGCTSVIAIVPKSQ